MSDFPRSRFHLPHWGWFLLATVALVVVGIGLSIWLPYHREQQVIQKIEDWGGNVKTVTCAPEWLKRLVGEDQIGQVKVFERVDYVHLEGTAIADVEVAHLGCLTYLRVLYLHHTAVTDAGLAHLSQCKNLKILWLYGTAFTDAGLACVSELPRLQSLYVENTAVTDAGLTHLTTSTTLQHLYLDDTAVTHKGVATLDKALRHCFIVVH